MKPFIIDFLWLGREVRVPSYGLMLAIAFSVGYFETLRRSIREKEIDPRHIENLFLIVIASAVIGSRLFHVVFEDPIYYFQNPAKIFAVWQGGYTFYGGLLIGLVATYGYTRIRRLSFLRIVDIMTPSVLFGLALGRVGCFLAGCCWGQPTSMPWGVVFSNPLSFAPHHTSPLHPTQLYESLGAALLFGVAWFKYNRRAYDGQIVFFALIGYALLRFFVEFFRGDDYRGFVLNGTLSYAQLVSLTILPFTIIAMFLFSRTKSIEGSLS